MYDKFAQTIQGANNIQTPSSPLGDFPTLRSLYQSSFQLPQSNAGAGGFQAQAQINDANSAAAVRQKMEENNQKIKELQAAQDPKNYEQIQKQDGGFDFRFTNPYTGEVKPINIHQFSQVTNKTPDKILADSNNNLDRQYVRDFGNLNTLVNALASNDTNAIQKLAVQIYGDNSKPVTDKTNQAAINKVNGLRSLKPDDLIRNFTQYYPNIYSDLPWNKLPQGTSQVYSSPGPGPGLGRALLGR
jgi:TolA-binding protein